MVKTIIFFFFVFSPLFLFSKNYSHSIGSGIFFDSTLNNLILNRIVIQGNTVTKDEVILRELSIKENQSLDFNKLQDEVDKVYNLGLFTKVDFLPLPIGNNQINLLITVEESFYLLPLPIGGFKGGDIKKFWGGIDFKYRNFRGMNESVGVSFALGYEPFVSFSYFTPWIGKKSHFFAGLNAKYSVYKNKSLTDGSENTTLYNENQVNEFTIDNINTGFILGKYFSVNTSSSLQFLFNYTKSSQINQNVTLNPEGIDRYLSLILEFNYDNRNLLEYTSYGSLFKVDYMRYGLFSKVFDFNKVRLDARKYISINFINSFSFIYAFRLLNVNSFGGDLPGYLKEYIGFNDYIRGWKNYIAEGDNKLCVYNELRFPVKSPQYIPGKEIPLINRLPYLKDISYKYGLYLTIFYDFGGVWNKRDIFSKIQFLSGFGSGINIIFPFSFVGRFELAYRNQQGKLIPQLNLNINNSF